MVGAFEVDDHDNLFDIQTSCTHARSDHNSLDAFFEIVDSEFSVSGIHCPMQDKRIIPVFKQLWIQVIRLVLFVDEDKDATFFIPLPQNLQQPKKLSHFLTNFHNLLNIPASLPSAANKYLNRIGQYLPG